MIHRMARRARDAILCAVLALVAVLMLVSTVESPSFFPSNRLPFFGSASSGPATPGEVVPPITSPRPVG
jgi:hypothetical protein